jgi:2'-5' RNA ligase
VSEERARLFTALELPAVARETLTRWCSERLDAIPAARRLDPEAFHVTLCFLGGHALDDVPEIARACRMVAGQRRVVLTLGRALWLPERRPRVLAVELEEGDKALTRLQAALSRSLQAGGWYEPEARPFLGHVTVARVPKGHTVSPPALPTPTPLRFVSAGVTLYRSHLGPEGARYQPLETVGLSG